jgi:ferritin-like metal-binding protein YciE
MTKPVKTMEELLIAELRDLMDAEKQIARALPKMVETATSEDLKAAFQEHLEQTREQIERLQDVFAQIGAKAGGNKSTGMHCVLDECDDLVRATEPGLVRDASLIAAAQRVEHYEMAGYGSARTFAQLLGHSEAADLLEDTLDEEKDADGRLTEIAESMVNAMAMAEGEYVIS